MKNYYENKSNRQVDKIKKSIKREVRKLEILAKFGRNPDSFLEKYEDPFFDAYRETEKDFEISNMKLCNSFEVAYNYLLHLRNWVGIEEDCSKCVF